VHDAVEEPSLSLEVPLRASEQAAFEATVCSQFVALKIYIKH
jgi:hypothetical protein